MDLSIAITGSTLDEARPALEAIAGRLAECGAEAECLLAASLNEIDSDTVIGGLPVRPFSPANSGYGAFLRAAREAARGAWLITLDAPVPDDASLVFGLWNRRNDGDLFIASRYTRGGSHSMPFFRALLSRMLNRLYRSGLSVGVEDLSSARRMYRTRVLRHVQIDGDDYDVLMETLLRFMSHGGRVVEVPWHYESRRHRQAPGTWLRLARSSLATFFRLHALRNSVDFPDYDTRAYDSRIWLQRYWQRKRFRIVREFSRNGGRMLDAGCGTSRIISTRPEMVAMDLKFSRLLYLKKSNPRRVQATAGLLPFADATFDTVISSQVIEHTEEDSCIRECLRVLKPGGILVLGTPDYGRIWWPITETLYGWVKRGGYVDEHITHYTLESLTRELMERGCTIRDYRYILGGELIIQAVKEAPAEGSTASGDA